MNPTISSLRRIGQIMTVSVALGLMVSGCGSSHKESITQTNQTLGKELQDLQASYEKGIITEKQYEDAKKRLIRKYTEY